MYGEAYWNPYALLNGILDQGYSSSARAGVFFASASFAFATLGTSIACNFIPFGADMTCLAPRYINIIRGQLLMLLVAFAIVPWRIVATANGFLNFLGGYSIFQGPVVAIMLVDYFIIRKGNIELEDLYTRSRLGRYWFFNGFNVRAFIAFVIGFILPLPGFAGTFGHNVGDAADHMFALGWVLSFLMGGLTYWVACMIFKIPGDDREHSFESKVGPAQTIINDGLHIEGHRPFHDKDSDMSQGNSESVRESKSVGTTV
jgi:nucleobase:cation symporter-1, NCS1 family